jgi:hypothetical protein
MCQGMCVCLQPRKPSYIYRISGRIYMGARLPDDQPLAGACGLGTTDHVELHKALLAMDDPGLRLPSYSTFEPLMPRATAVHTEDTDIFASHTTYELPCSSGGVFSDRVHRFTLNHTLSGRLNSSLGAWCERKAEAAIEYERLIRASLPPQLADVALSVRRAGSAAGVRLSNQGGFQSYHDLFSEQVGKKRKHSHRHCRRVRLH